MEKRTQPVKNQNNQMFCNNCGEKGHLFRTCRDPILSCGLMLINTAELPVNPNDVKVMMIRRRDSMSFAEFMRGKYEPDNKEYLGKLFTNMTLKEQAAIVCEPFDTIWKSLWGEDRSSHDYAISKEKFEKLDKLRLMIDFMSQYTEPEWGFPKGRRIRGESDMDCAIREFTEETNVPRDSYVILKNIILEETFVGLNNVKYKHIYFVALLKKPEMINIYQKFTTLQRREISGIDWKTIKECEELIRPHHIERQEMINQLKGILETFSTI